MGAHIAGIRGIVKVIPSESFCQSQKAQIWSKPLPMFRPAQKQSIYIQVSVEIVPVSTKSALWLAPSTSKPGFVPQDKIAIEWDGAKAFWSHVANMTQNNYEGTIYKAWRLVQAFFMLLFCFFAFLLKISKKHQLIL